ncbi:hypothetical protein JCM8208_000296 [Rhodotorula glutinis]
MRLQLVDRDLYAICTPILWKNVRISDQGTAIARLANILPRHAQDVRRLEATGCQVPMYNYNGKFIGPSVEHGHVVATWLPLCVGIEELELRRPNSTQLAPLALDKLLVFEITAFAPDYCVDEVPFVRQLSALTSLSLVSSRDVRPSPPGISSVVEALCALRHLKHLELENSLSVSDEALTMKAGEREKMPPLESLELTGSGTVLSFPILHTFVSAFARTLTSLRLAYTDVHGVELPADTAFVLPHLSSLALGTDLPSSTLLHLFPPTTPFTFFRLNGVPGLRDHVADLLDFLRSHRATLEKIYVSEAAIGEDDDESDFLAMPSTTAVLDDSDIKEIEDCAAALGSALVVFEPEIYYDSDDDYYYDDDSLYSID